MYKPLYFIAVSERLSVGDLDSALMLRNGNLC